MADSPTPFLTPKEVAAMFRVDVRTVQRMVQRGQIPQPIRYTQKLVLFRVADIEEHIAQVRTGGAV